MYHNTLLSYCSILTVCSSSLFSLYLCTSSGLFDPFVFILFSFLVPNSFSLIFRLSFPRVSANKYVIEVVFFWSQYCKTFIASVCGYISRKNIDSTLATFDGVSLQRGTRYYKTFQTNSIDTFDLACQCANSLIAPNTQQTFSILGVAAIAPWFCLRLPSCGPRFESQAHHLRFFSICIIEIVSRK